MADNDDLMLEVTASTDKADNALKKLFNTLDKFQAHIEKVTPSLSKFTEKLDSITAGSKAFAMLDKLTKGTGDLSSASKKAEANEAMYQARLDRANVSMERSRVQSERLAAARQKLAEANAIDAHNEAAFSMSPEDFKKNFDHSGTESPAETVIPEVPETNVSSMKYNMAEIQAQIDSITSGIGKKGPKINIDTDAATAEIRKIGEYIDSLTPKVSAMSSAAQANFNGIAAKLTTVSQRIDNQRMLYRSLADQAARVAQEQGSGSTAYLQMEKRMLSADSAAQRLSETQEKLKAELADVTSATGKVGTGMTDAGDKSEKAASKSTSAWSNTMRMMEKMFVRIAAFRIFSAISQSIVTGIQDMAQASGQANATMSALATSSLYLKNSVTAALMPALQALTPVIVRVADAISWAANQLAIFIAQVTGQKTVTIATKSYVDYAKSLNKTGDNAADTSKKVKELQRTIMGFDELNVLNKNVNDALASSPKSNTPDYGSMFKTIPTPKSNFDPSSLFKDVPKVFDKLKDAADKGGKALDKVKDKAKELEKELNKVKLPALGSWKVPAFPKVTVPALGLGEWNRSKNKYQQPVRAPTLTPATAPSIILKGFLGSKVNYQTTITPPSVTPAVAPALVLNTLFAPSIQAAGQKIRDFSTSTQATVSVWGTNVSSNFGKTWNAVSASTGIVLSSVKGKISQYGRDSSSTFARVGNNIMTNVRTTFSYVPTAVSSGLNAAGRDVSSWLTSTSRGFANFGSNIVSNIGKTMSAWYTNFISGLSSAWNQFTGFMSGVGKNIGNWWNANKSWAAPVAVGLGVAAIAIAAIPSGGTSIAAAPALAAAALATGGLVTGPTLSLIGEGNDNEAVLPLNQSVFSQIAQGIRRNSDSGGVSDEALGLLRSIDESIKQGHSINVRMDVDGKPFVNKVINEMDNRDRRFHPVKQY